MTSYQYNLNDLIALMQHLRDPNIGCPWDVKQTYRSITQSTIEEAYEVVDAIESEDFQHLREELGDLLFQVIFYSQLADEDNYFNFHQVVEGLTQKLIRRHPHVFPDGTLSRRVDVQRLESDAQVKERWEAIKAQERQAKGKSGLLDDVPLGLPAFSRGVKLQKRAATVGFDWTSVSGVFDKVHEELGELKNAIEFSSEESISDELGDLFFSLVNLSRHLKRDPETLMRRANQKFIRRFKFIENELQQKGIKLDEASTELLEQLWELAKIQGPGAAPNNSVE